MVLTGDGGLIAHVTKFEPHLWAIDENLINRLRSDCQQVRQGIKMHFLTP